VVDSLLDDAKRRKEEGKKVRTARQDGGARKEQLNSTQSVASPMKKGE